MAPRGSIIPVLCLFAYAALLLNLVSPAVRLESPIANSVFLAAAQLLPFIAVHRSRRQRSRAKRFLLAALSTAACLPAFTLGPGSLVCAASIVTDGSDASFERRNSMETPFGKVVAYRTNGGATTSFGIEVRQQCSLLPGLLIVRHLGAEYPASEVQFSPLGGRSIRATYPYPGRRPVETVQSLRLRQLPCWRGTG